MPSLEPSVSEARRVLLVRDERNNPMLYYAVVFFVLALIAGFFGFFGIAAGAAGIAKILFFVFIVFAVVSFLTGRRAPV